MLSNKSYLIQAFYNWITDSNCTPIILVDATAVDEYGLQLDDNDDGQISFNISVNAVRNLQIGYEQLEFQARFSGVTKYLSIPITSIIAIYANENNEGMYFDYVEEEFSSQQEQLSHGKSSLDDENRPNLYLVE